MSPTLPARKAGGKRVPAPNSRTLPVMEPEYVTLEDGTQVPLQVPPGLPAAQAKAIIEYLKANPQAAKAAYEQAQTLLKNPAMARQFLNMNANPNLEMAERFQVLKDDPELKHVFEDLTANGASAMQKYWDDEELMLKISQKLRQADVATGAAQAEQQQQQEKPKPKINNIHDAAKFGDEEAATKFIDEGADVDKKNDRGITPLGIAVGFNRVGMVKLLLSKGADVKFRDAAGNNLMHYAAGYGRQEIAGILLEAGCELEAANNQKLKPIDVAKQNREMGMVKFLKEKGAELSEPEAKPQQQEGEQQSEEGQPQQQEGEGSAAEGTAATKPKAAAKPAKAVAAKVVRTAAKK